MGKGDQGYWLHCAVAPSQAVVPLHIGLISNLSNTRLVGLRERQEK